MTARHWLLLCGLVLVLVMGLNRAAPGVAQAPERGLSPMLVSHESPCPRDNEALSTVAPFIQARMRNYDWMHGQVTPNAEVNITPRDGLGQLKGTAFVASDDGGWFGGTEVHDEDDDPVDVVAGDSVAVVYDSSDPVVVTSRTDSGAGSLRQVLLSAIPGDTITFDPVVFPRTSPMTITLLSALLEINQGNLIGLDLDGTRDFRVQAMVISLDRSQDQTFFVGTRFHGVWKTTDGGSASGALEQL